MVSTELQPSPREEYGWSDELNVIQLDEDGREAAIARAARDEHVYPISALTGEGLDVLLQAVATALVGRRFEDELHLTFEDGRRRAWLFEQDVILSEDQTDEGFTIRVRWTEKQARRYAAL